LWAQADILMVTDGQIPNPSQQLLDRIAAARGELGLEVHGLIVGDKTQASRTCCLCEGRSTCRTTGVVVFGYGFLHA